MARVSPFRIALLVVCGLAWTWAQPLDVLESGPNPAFVALALDTPEKDVSVARDQRSPQFGFGSYDYFDGPRQFKNRRKHKPLGHGCRTHHGCGGNHGGSIASATAGSFGSGNHGGSTSHASSSVLSFGPITISQAQAHSQSQSSNRGGGNYGDYGDYGGYGRY